MKKSIAQTAANDPTIKRGATFIYDHSKAPKRFDFICFLGEMPSEQNRYLMLYRLCGIPGDTVAIIDGILFVNNQMADKGFSLKHNYFLSKPTYEKLKAEIPVDDNFQINADADSVLIPIDDELVQQRNLPARRLVLARTAQDSLISKRFSNEWNQDNFGPVVVPDHFYFVLGDNRHNAWDSRYRGFIDKKDFLGTVVNIK